MRTNQKKPKKKKNWNKKNTSDSHGVGEYSYFIPTTTSQSQIFCSVQLLPRDLVQSDPCTYIYIHYTHFVPQKLEEKKRKGKKEKEKEKEKKKR